MEKIVFKNLRFRSIIIISVFFVYSVFTIFLFTLFNRFYYETTRKEFVDRNKMSAKIIAEWIDSQSKLLGNEAKLFSEDGIVHNSLYSDSYIYIKIGKTHRDQLDPSFIEVTPVNKLMFIKLANEIKFKLNSQLTVKSEKRVAIISNKFEIQGHTSGFIRTYDKEKDNRYIADEIGMNRSNLGAGGLSVIDCVNEKFVLKGLHKIGVIDALGVIMISQELNGFMLEEIKKNVNKEVVLVKKNSDGSCKIIDSTIFIGSNRLNDYVLPKFVINEDNYSEISIKGKRIGLSLVPITDYDGKIIGYVGSGFYVSDMTAVYSKTIKYFVPYDIIFSLIMLAIIYVIIRRLFRPFTGIINGIIDIRDGKYNNRIELDTAGELKLLIDYVNEMASAVKEREGRLIDLNHEIEDTQREVLITLGSIGESRSKETANHVKRVSEYSRLLALKINIDEKEAEMIRIASSMHDIGKIAVPDAILLKPGKLDPEEFEIIKKHSQIGYEMLRHSTRAILWASAVIALQHHEKWDGTGYPRNLAGTDIHVYGRIVAIADVFDALSSDRCYKKAWPMDKVIELIKEQSGKHFDPRLVDAFIGNLDKFLEIKERYRDEVEE